MTYNDNISIELPDAAAPPAPPAAAGVTIQTSVVALDV